MWQWRSLGISLIPLDAFRRLPLQDVDFRCPHEESHGCVRPIRFGYHVLPRGHCCS